MSAPQPAITEHTPGRMLLRTSSIEEAEDGAARLLSAHRLRVTDGQLDARIHGVSLGSVALFHMDYGSAVTVTGPPLDGYVGITIPLRGVLRVDHARSRFDAVAGRAAAVITPEAPMVLQWSRDLRMFLLRIEVTALRSFSRCLGPGAGGLEAAETIRFDPLLADRAALAGVLGCARMIQLAADQLGVDGGWPPAVATRLREQAMMTLLLAQPHSRRDQLSGGRRPVSRAAVRQAVDLVEADPARYLTTPSLAVAVGVGVRALQAGFQQALGTSPHAYILDVRLRRAHEELLGACSDDGATVSEIARRWGFVNIGRFAQQYRQVHGVLPSETLRRT
ncbi:AraC family transcriptional regulator [Pseudonocardia sp. GCM10023141]|uniref:AraC family transcriptional regulator n=1 Tax=Pseudonocardia sp. GCM10023141 TaxID=3252653 RepID=UPI0036211B4F